VPGFLDIRLIKGRQVHADIALMRRMLASTLLIFLVCLWATPVQATSITAERPDTATWVDTWLHRDGRSVGRNELQVSPMPTMHVRLTPGYATHIWWVAKNVGGMHYAHYSEIEFSGCHSADGIGFRYYTAGGSPVSWKVTHDRYVHTAYEGNTTALRIRVLAARPNRSTTCVLRTRASSGGGRDGVRLTVAS
jgi:hypothetical protein